MRTRLLALSCALMLAACASSGPRRESAPATSAGAADADTWAAAALRSWAEDRNAPQALTQIKKATELSANRADLAWLHVRLCIETAGCQPEALEARLRKLDSANGSVWLGVLARAQTPRDPQSEQQILDAMSRAERFDVYWTSLASKLTVALNAATKAPETEKAPLTASLNRVTNWLSSLSTPAFKAVSSACDKQRTVEASAVQRCVKVAQALQRGDTALVELVGLGIAQRFATPSTMAALTIDRRVTSLTYLGETSASIIQAQVEHERFSAQIIELMKKLRREQDVSAAILRWAGEPPEPPPSPLR